MNYHASTIAVVVGALLFILAGCKNATPPFEPPSKPVATRVFPASPTAFHASPGSGVTAPVVLVHDQFGNPRPGVIIHFTVVSGDGLVESHVALTDAAGQATAGNWVLGLEPGLNLVIAMVAELPPLAFMATGGLEPVKAAYGLARVNDEQVPMVADFADYRIGGYYILYEDGTFTLGSVWGGVDGLIQSSEKVGVYSQVGSLITFEEAGSTWTGSIGGDSLHVHGDGQDRVEVFAVTPPVSPTGGFPPVARPATVYNRRTPNSGGSLSRYVLYADGTFGLQYVHPAFGFFEYAGKYSLADSVITFDFDDYWNQATGTVRGEELVVEYGIIMALSDFEDGVFVLARVYATDAAEVSLAHADGSETATRGSSSRKRPSPVRSSWLHRVLLQ